MSADFSRDFPATEADLPAVLDAIEAWLDAADMAMPDVARLMIAFDEVLSNIVNYGGGTIRVEIALRDHAIRAVVSDDGPPFDPLDRPVPDTELDMDDRPIGGLGIHLVREMMDELTYSYEMQRNRLTFSKTF